MMRKMTVEESLERAQTAYRMGDFDLAKKLLERIIPVAPDNPMIYNLLGSIQEREHNYDLAISYFKKAIDSKGDTLSSYNNLAVAYKNKGDYEKSLDVFRKLMQYNPNRADIYYNLGNLYKDINLYQNAIEYYSAALEKDPSYIVAYNNLGTVHEKLGQYAEALKVYHRGLQFDMNNPLLHFNVGVIYKRENRLREAEQEFILALKNQPGFTGAKNNLAIILQKRGEYERALSYFREILKSEPANAEVHNNMAVILGEQRIIDASVHHYREALRINPRYHKARINLAMLYEEEGLHQEALHELRELLKLEPQHMEARLRMGEIYLGIDKISESLEQFRSILSKDPNNALALRGEGKALLKKGDLKRALQIKDKLQQLLPDNRDFCLDLAFTFKELRQYKKAEEEILQYLSKNTNKIEAKILYADIAMAQSKKEDAERVLLDIITAGVKDPEIQFMLARVYKEMGRQEEAIEILGDLVNVQGAQDELKDSRRLNDIMKLYEETIAEYEEKMKSRWEHNLAKFQEIGLDQGPAIQTAQDSFLLETELPVEETVPIINIGGMTPVFEVREEEEYLKLDEEEEEIDLVRERVLPIQEEEPQTLINLLDSQELYDESPHYERGASTQPPRQPGRPQLPAQQMQGLAEDLPPEPKQYTPPPPWQPAPPPYQQNQGLSKDSIDAIGQGIAESMKKMQESLAQSAVTNALLSQMAKQQVPPVIMYAPPQRTTPPPPPPVDNIPEERGKVPPTYPGEMPDDKEPEDEGLPRFIEDEDKKKETEEELLFEEPRIEDSREEPVHEEGIESLTEETPLPENSLEEDKELEITPDTDDMEIYLEEEPEDFLEKEALGTPSEDDTEQENGNLRSELKNYISDVRNNLDQREEAKKPVKLLDYLANMSNYLPQENRFSLLGNEMRLRVELLRSKLSGKRGLFERIQSSFKIPEQGDFDGNVITRKNLVSTFSFIRELSQYVPDKNLSSLMRNKIESILGKIRSVSGG